MLKEKALIVSINISQWTGRKFDKRATSTVETTHLTRGKVGQYTKKLLPGAKELEEIQRQAGIIRSFFYTQTLPWFSDGSRILSSVNYLPFVHEFNRLKGEYQKTVDRFLTEYPRLRAEAQANLGDLFSDTDYPSEARLRELFNCQAHYMPIPDVADFRIDIGTAEQENFVKRIQEAESEAMRDCWARLHEVITTATEKLKDPTAIFRDTLIENITSICSLLPKLNFTGDAQLESIRQEVEKTVSGIEPQELRNSKLARSVAVQQLSEIESKMSAIMGA